MASAAEIELFLTGNYKMEKFHEFPASDDYNSVYRGLWSLGAGRSQQVRIIIHEDFLVIESPFADVDELSLPAAMKAAENDIFGIKIEGGHYVIRHVIPLADIDESEVDWGVNLVANVADGLERDSVGGDSL